MTAASGRHGAYGDALARLLEFRGHDVGREYYFNDAGTQIEKLGASIRARARGEDVPEGGYEGDYVRELAARDPRRRRARRRRARAASASSGMFERIKTRARDLPRRVRRLLQRGAAARGRAVAGRARARARSTRAGHLYRADGALWLRTTTFGDDKDRVLVRSSGQRTYFAADVAYLADKLGRGFERLILPLGRRPPRLHCRGCGRRWRRSARTRAPRDADPAVRPHHRARRARVDVQAPRRLRDARGAHRDDRRGRDALLHAAALARHDVRPRPRPRAGAVVGQPRLLRPVRARADRVDPRAGGRGAGRARAARGRELRRRARSRRADADQEAAGVRRGGRGGDGQARAASHRRVRARARADVHGVLPRLPGRSAPRARASSPSASRSASRRSARSRARWTCSASARPQAM